MNINIKEEIIQQAINDSSVQAITRALSGYDVQPSIGKCISEEVANGAISEAIAQAIKSIDNKAMTALLASELAQGIRIAITSLMEEAVVSVVLKIRGVSQYGITAAQIKEVRNELFNPKEMKKEEEK